MKPLITLLAVGSQGDLNPACALACGLQKAGYRVRVATHRNFAQFVAQQGIEFAPIAGNFKEILGSEAGYQLLEGKNVKLVGEELFKEMLQDALQACRGSRAIIFFPLSVWGYHIAEKLGILCFLASYIPLSPTKEYAFLRFGTPTQNPLKAWLNPWSYRLIEFLIWQRDRQVINAFRRELALPTLPYLGIAFRRQTPPHLATVPVLYCFSRSVISEPQDWKEHIHITGNWFLNANYQPPQTLVDFLSCGSTIYMGFGSMTTRNPQRLTEIVLKALHSTKQRAVLHSGWAGLGRESLPENILIVNDYVPFDWLFGHMQAVVHHGGSGTTALGLRAGVPQVIVPFFADQPAWGSKLAHLGVSPRPIPVQQLSAQNLAAAIDVALNDAQMRQRAKTLGAKIRAENGVERAVAIINRYLDE